MIRIITLTVVFTMMFFCSGCTTRADFATIYGTEPGGTVSGY